MSVRLSHLVRLAAVTAGAAIVAAPAFAGGGYYPPPHAVPEPSTLALLGVAIPGAAAWIKHKLF